MKKILIAVAWPYVNGDLHVGHGTGYLLPADIAARYHRSIGDKVLMVSGSDCFGTPITVEADKRGATPKEIADEYHAKDEELLLSKLKLTYDMYTRTDTEHHKKIVQEVFLQMLKNGYITIGTSRQYYSENEGKYLPDRYVEGTCKFCGYNESRSDQCDKCGKLLGENDLDNPKSKLTKDPVSLKDSQHYFVDWPKLQLKIEAFVKSKGPAWKNWVYQETLGWFSGEGLKPRAITRDIDWGVPLPVEEIPSELRIEGLEHKRIYVWFDAVIGYLSASKLWSLKHPESGLTWEDFWYADDAKHLYFMGKDNLPFHTLFWPGQLMATDPKLHLPDIASINMFMDYEGQKFSKSRGVTVPLSNMVDYFGNDALRFYLTYTMPETKDSSFSWNDFVSVNNDVLISTFGNFINRTLSMAYGFEEKEVTSSEILSDTKLRIEEFFTAARKSLDNLEFRKYQDAMISLSDWGNKLIDQHQTYKLKSANPKEFALQIKQLLAIVRAISIGASALLPDFCEKLAAQMGLTTNQLWPEAGKEIKMIENDLEKLHQTGKPQPLFRKLAPEDIEEFLRLGGIARPKTI